MVKDLATCQKESLGGFELDFRLNGSDLGVFDSGKAKFDGGKAKSCVDKIAGASCDLTDEVQRGLSLLNPRALPEACGQAFTGTLHAGEVCTSSAECISQICQGPSCDHACCPGTCTGDAAPAIAKLGESCAQARCASGSFCLANTCTALKPAGSACGDFEECEYGAACISGACIKLPHSGESCTNFCTDFGAICDPTTKKCVSVALGGETCRGQGFQSDCSSLYSCDAGRCSAGLALGATCTVMDICADFRAFCDIPDNADQGTCVLPKANGGSCLFSSDCDSAFCDIQMFVCADAPVCM
ncbi:MAG TPA: hypothetical protein VLM79_28185 [Kofleriaceae bacterium]|nr:hypothetical protein [Kofleriaceae bacterium]